MSQFPLPLPESRVQRPETRDREQRPRNDMFQESRVFSRTQSFPPFPFFFPLPRFHHSLSWDPPPVHRPLCFLIPIPDPRSKCASDLPAGSCMNAGCMRFERPEEIVRTFLTQVCQPPCSGLWPQSQPAPNPLRLRAKGSRLRGCSRAQG